MTTKSIHLSNLILALLLLLITFAIPIVQYQRSTDENRRLAQQNTELLQTVNSMTKQLSELKKKNVELTEYADEVDNLIQQQFDLLDEIFTDLYPTDEPEQTKPNRGDERAAYKLTASERNLVEQVVMAEASGEPYEGQMLVAQCMLNACEIDSIRPAEVIEAYRYAKCRPEPSDSVIKAVSAVFDRGETVVDAPIVYFYAPGRVKSTFHESQKFVCEVGGHRFFAEAD